jgi:hypothetical protein
MVADAKDAIVVVLFVVHAFVFHVVQRIMAAVAYLSRRGKDKGRRRRLQEIQEDVTNTRG